MEKIDKTSLPTISVDQMKEIDRLMVEEIGVPIIMMMENAGRAIAHVIRSSLDGSVQGKTITVMAGKGNNGGGTLAAARHLLNAGAHVTALLSNKDSEMTKPASAQVQILKNSGASLFYFDEVEENKAESILKDSDIILDGLVGYRLQGDPRKPISQMINLANMVDTIVISNDLPSGLDGETGEPMNPTVNAYATITLALPKRGLLSERALDYTGELYLADVSVTSSVYRSLKLNIPNIFEKASVVRLV
ncbi:MAG: NAD(P)H-hydrate epimerase [Candidatus Dojkabacteria bacterium]